MSTINITGTGGIIEGNLGAANVNVNLDSALYFDGSTRVDMNDTDQTAPFSVSAWINFTSGEHIVNKEGSWFLYIDSSNRVRFDLAGLSPSFVRGGADKATVGWHHVAATFDGSGNSAIYIDGVSVATQSHSGTLTQTSSDLNIGDVAAGSSSFVGYIADVKIFNDELTTTEPALLASKIQADCDVLGVGNLLHWYKLNEGTGTNAEDYQSGGSDADGTISNGTWKFDQYSVDVYDNSTTTDGTFTVTQGKVEGKSLTCLDYDAGNDHVDVGDSNNIITGTNVTYACWVKVENSDTTSAYLIANLKGAGSTNLSLQVNQSAGEIDGIIWDGSSAHNRVDYAAGINDGKWHHLILTTTSSAQALYLDGVQVATSSFTFGNAASTDHMLLGARESGANALQGQLRDVRVFDYTLSADQASSLYSGSYNVTPDHWWKMDDSIVGTSTTNVADSGTGTTRNGTATFFNNYTGVNAASDWINGTLDLDGGLTIAANGTLSAPRGNLDLATALDINCTNVDPTSAGNQWIHNSGKVRYMGAGAHATWTPNNATFFDIDLATSSGHDLLLQESITILGTLDLTGSNDWWILDANGAAGNVTMTMGNDSNQATIESDTAKRFGFKPHSSREILITGGSSLKPCLVTGGDWYWDLGAGTAGIKLANMNFDPDIVTHESGSNAVKIILTGDCEFDAVTVSSGDTLDLNGQRMEASGDVSVAGTIDFGAGLFVGAGLDIDGTADGETGADIILTHNGSTNTMEIGDSSMVGDATTNVLINRSVNMNWSSSSHYAGNLIVGAATLETDSGTSCKCNNLTVATGATLDGNDDTLTVAGDFTTSGGLIGKSAIVCDGTGDYVTVTDHATLDFNASGDVTLDCWVKAGTTGNDHNHEIIEKQDSGTGARWQFMYMHSADTIEFVISDGSGSATALYTGARAALYDDKWHNLVGVRDAGSTLKLYLDGKLIASATDTEGDISNNGALLIGKGGTAEFQGTIARVSVWAEALTAAKIRAMMFQDWTTMAADATHTDGNAKLWLEFSEGTGSTVEDLSAQSNNGAITNATWAGAGTFTYGTSTLVMTGSGKKINMLNDDSVNNLTIATGGDSNAITLTDISGGNSVLVVYGTLEQTSGKLVSSNVESIQFGKTYGNLKAASGKGAIAFADLYRFYIYQNSQSGAINFPHADSADNDITTKRLFITSSSTIETKATGNLTITEELEVSNGNTFNANGNTIAVKLVDSNGGTLDLTNSTMNFSVTGSGDQLNLDASSTLLTGNTAITGNGALNKTDAILPAAGGFEVVGDVKFLKMNTDADLTVVGSVVDCILEDSTANIRQWHHTLDTQQLLDADEAGDDDIKLPKPSLDNAHELQLGG